MISCWFGVHSYEQVEGPPKPVYSSHKNGRPIPPPATRIDFGAYGSGYYSHSYYECRECGKRKKITKRIIVPSIEEEWLKNK